MALRWVRRRWFFSENVTEEGSNWQGIGSCFEVLGERTKRSGVWLVFSLDVKEMELLGHLEEFALLLVVVQF